MATGYFLVVLGGSDPAFIPLVAREMGGFLNGGGLPSAIEWAGSLKVGAAPLLTPLRLGATSSFPACVGFTEGEPI